jgi:type IV pilus assembly protein PilY1
LPEINLHLTKQLVIHMKLNKIKHSFAGALALSVIALLPPAARAQTTYTENFTGGTTNNSWYFFNGACLTAGSSTGTTSPGQIPNCVGLQYYKNKGDNTLVGGNTGTLPDDPTLGGALRFTNGCINPTSCSSGGYNQNGAILSNFTFPTNNGIQVTFTTETYRGNSLSGGGGVADGADGMSFFLQSVDQGQVADLGAFGGSLGYTCSNSNNDGTLRASGQPRGYDGLIGGYIGLGIDEYGNFLNAGDNTSTSASSGAAFQGNRIGLRGAGSTAWTYLNATYPNQYPSTLSYSQRASAVQQACKNGYVYDWSGSSAPSTPYTGANGANVALTNYGAIPGAFKLLGTTIKIANEAALYRGPSPSGQTGTNYGVPITYNLTVTPAGLLSLSYSYNGGVFQPVIAGQDITAANGSLPNNVRFGFAGSTGGGTNVHEIMCFQAQPASQSTVSAGINQKQSAKVQVGSQVYFAYYNPNNWPGSLTSQYLVTDPNGSGTLILNPAANWDASCVLTDIAAGQTCAATGVAGPTAGEAPTSRTILTWDGSKGIPFEWNKLTAAQQSALDTNDSTVTANRLNYLRGDRSNELTTKGVGLYRARTSVLGDIVDSSPSWVGAPSAVYPAVWVDSYPNGGSTTAPTPPENGGGAQSYAAFMTAQQTRTNMVYAGANDGLLHGFRSGSFDTSGNYVSATNDGLETLAYMPGYIVNTINSFTNVSNDFSNPQYAHHFDVDATPGTGDLFYGNQWHTWLVGGLGPGGNAIFALDITSPGLAGAAAFSESAAQTTVIGEWSTTTSVAGVTTSTITCANVASCGNNLGKTYGTPQIRRFHNGNWGFIVGNGFGSSTGDAGIYVVSVDSSSGAMTWYYLSTNQPVTTGCGGATPSAACDGIAFPAAMDLDHDNITDYVYAGDLLGNLWRFDLTNSDPTKWAVASTPLFKTSGGQPITTRPLVVINNAGPVSRLMVEFGTGQQTPITNTNPATYSTAQQAIYGIWDWNMSVWNAKSTHPFASLPSNATGASLSTLQVQSITGSFDASLSATGSAYRTVTNTPVCYADMSGCTQYGWYLSLPIGPANPSLANSPTVAEQVLFGPALLSGVFVVNTTVPPTNSPTTCTTTPVTSWTMALDPLTGGALNSGFFQFYTGATINVTTTVNGQVTTQGVSGVADLGTGTPTSVIYNNQMYIISSPNANGTPPPCSQSDASKCICPPGTPNCHTPQGHNKNVSAQRLMWIERR